MSAAGAWLRATEYWRQSIFFIRHDLDDKRLQEGWRRHRAAFRAALPPLPWVTTTAEIPFGGGTITGYLMRPVGAIAPRPTAMSGPTLALPVATTITLAFFPHRARIETDDAPVERRIENLALRVDVVACDMANGTGSVQFHDSSISEIAGTAETGAW